MIEATIAVVAARVIDAARFALADMAVEAARAICTAWPATADTAVVAETVWK